MLVALPRIGLPFAACLVVGCVDAGILAGAADHDDSARGRKQGVIDFRILANAADDSVAIEELTEFLSPRNVAQKERLQVALEASKRTGSPPPVVMDSVANKPAPRTYQVHLPPGFEARMIQYEWVQLGSAQMKSLELDKQPDPANARSHFLSEHLEQAVFLPGHGPHLPYALHGALFYARRRNGNARELDVFVLSRLPELDRTGATASITNEQITEAYADLEGPFGPVIQFTFDKLGTERLSELTRRNLPSRTGDREQRRCLAVIVEGKVVSAPAITGPIAGRAQITGSFTNKEAVEIARMMVSKRTVQGASERADEVRLPQGTGERWLYSGALVAAVAIIAGIVVIRKRRRRGASVGSTPITARQDSNGPASP